MIPHIVRLLQVKGDNVAVTTACRDNSVAIGGKTIQSFSGFGKLDLDFDTIKKKNQQFLIFKKFGTV